MVWKKGQSGNPSGRAAMPPELRKSFRDATPEAFKTLMHIMKNGKNEANRIAAAEKILDRAYGKAPQALDVSGEIQGGNNTAYVVNIYSKELPEHMRNVVNDNGQKAIGTNGTGKKKP